MKKYELTEETKTLADGTVLHRIRAVRDFTLVDGTEVHKGDLGGWVEREDNLSQDGSARVCGSALKSKKRTAIGGASHGKSRDGEAEAVRTAVGRESVAQGGTRSNTTQ